MTEREAVQHLCWRVLDLVGRRKASDLEDLALAVGGPRPLASRDWESIKGEVLQTLDQLSSGAIRDQTVKEDVPREEPPSRDPKKERHLILKPGMPLPVGTFTKSWPLTKDYGKNVINLVYEPKWPQ